MSVKRQAINVLPAQTNQNLETTDDKGIGTKGGLCAIRFVKYL